MPVKIERIPDRAGAVVWLTGLSGAGKSTLAKLLKRRLQDMFRPSVVLDGDVVRAGLCRDLGFGRTDRGEHVRRTGAVARLVSDGGVIVLVAMISPDEVDRRAVRTSMEDRSFVEVHLSTPLEECERRDPKGLYKLARSERLSDFAGIDFPYEPPECPEVRLDTTTLRPEACVARILEALAKVVVGLDAADAKRSSP